MQVATKFDHKRYSPIKSYYFYFGAIDKISGLYLIHKSSVCRVPECTEDYKAGGPSQAGELSKFPNILQSHFAPYNKS